MISSPRLKMYYEPHASRTNLIVMTSAHVTRASLSKVAGEETTAESVCFLYEGNEYRALVKNEVILSAGYVSRSPQGMGNTLSFAVSPGYLRAIMSPQVIVRVSPLVTAPHISADPRALRNW